MRRCKIPALAAVLLSILTAGPSMAVEYVVTDLGTLGGVTSYPTAINDAGQVVGAADSSSGGLHAFVYSNGTMTDLGTLGGQWSEALGINATGEAVGTIMTFVAPSYSYPFLYANGTMAALPVSGATGAIAINDAGQILGGGGGQTFIYANGTTEYLPEFLGTNQDYPCAMNDSAQIVGYANVIGPLGYYSDHAFVYSNGTTTDLGWLAAPTGGEEDSRACAINASGKVVGFSATIAGDDVHTHAFLYSNGTMTDLGMPPDCNVSSQATGINAGGQVVGFAYSSAAGVGGLASHAFLYSSRTMTDLNSLINPASAWTLTEATAINDSGQIVGSGYYAGGIHPLGFLLTPATPGDANADGRVDINDLTIVLANFGQTGMTWSQGCMDGDPSGTVDMNDLTIVLANYGSGVTAAAGVKAVPEPASLVLLLAALACLLATMRRPAREKPRRLGRKS